MMASFKFLLITVLGVGLLTSLFLSDASAQVTNVDGTDVGKPEECTSELFLDAENAYQNTFGVRGNDWAYLAEKLIGKILAVCPNAKLNPVFQSEIETLGEKKADRLIYIAKYYLGPNFSNGRGIRGARSRLKQIMEGVPTYSKMDEVLYLLGESYLFNGEIDEAKNAFENLYERFPFSEFVGKAQIDLDELSRVPQ